MVRWSRVAIVAPLVVAVVLFAGCGDGGSGGAASYTAADLRTGEKVSLETLAGSPVVLSAWTTWCHNCDEDLAELSEFSRSSRSKGFEVVAVNLDVGDVDDEIDAKIAEHDLTTTLWRDRTNSFRAAFGSVGVPTTVVLDATGRVVRVLPGVVDFADPSVTAVLEEARKAAS